MPVIATEPRSFLGPETHAEAAWQKLHTPGTGPEERVEAIESFAAACRALEEYGMRSVKALEELALSADPAALPEAFCAARILAEIGTADAADALVRVALSPDIAVAGRALAALPSMRLSQVSQTRLIDAMRGQATLADTHRRSLLAPGLARQLLVSDDFEATAWARLHPLVTVRAAWARALARVGGAAAKAHLPAMADDPEAIVRVWAAFGRILEGDTGALAILVRGLASRSCEERVASVGLLGVLPLPEVVPHVLAATLDRSPVVACAALMRAGHLGVRDSLLAIAAQLDHRRTDVVEHAAWALRDLLGEDPGLAWSGRRLTAACVGEVRAACRATHALWAPGMRYLEGRPLDARAVARVLDRPAGGDVEAAYFTLLGMSGCSFGFDPAADEVANRRSVRKLAAWAAERGRCLIPGAFHHRGTVVRPAA
jgi:HEAT repeat protein